ncbi:two-component sensor histidine kinase [Pseudoalteromonas rubra]|uniref:histidine kinase n=1 Tax=Pseudoalteromonas rubra TaxID=43658 RepID=A0A5S3WLI3_9GAMM|nr:HAMP domain-containing sensor histidine kinase [Pseudoalteromonas rubra]TMP28621.1 two-component sensor histidine kinase [Pseudoalteromonas rubra]TMP30552.1 two-component sensor histidine kinase [Pseudoalteromonas rubra]
MKKLYLYLLASALISIVVLGWLLDTLSQQAEPAEDAFAWQAKLLYGVTNQSASIPETLRPAYMEQVSKDFDLPITYSSGDSLALPVELKNQMMQPEGLLLEDDMGYYLLKSAPSLAPDYLELRLEKPPEQYDSDVFLTLAFYAGICTFMWVILAPLAKRLTVLVSAAKQFASGDLSARIEVNHFTYIKDLELTFNRMANQIEKLLAENKLMASSLSHDIRTPVACLRFGFDAAFEEDDIEQVHALMHRMEKDLDQMEDMLASYLSFATLEQKSHLLKFAPTQLDGYIRHVVEQMTPKLTNKQINASVSVPAHLQLDADPHWLARAISNLLSNACDFANKQIIVSAQQLDHQIEIRVEDDGPGIEEENWDKVFNPFFQEQGHRNRAGKSYGLGLAIVAKVVDWHHGQASVSRSDLLGGAKFTLTFPCKAPRNTVKAD